MPQKVVGFKKGAEESQTQLAADWKPGLKCPDGIARLPPSPKELLLEVSFGNGEKEMSPGTHSYLY